MKKLYTSKEIKDKINPDDRRVKNYEIRILMKEPTMEEILELVTFWRDDKGKLQVWMVGFYGELERLNLNNKILRLTNKRRLKHIALLEEERDEAREFAKAERLNARKISSHKSGWVNFPWEVDSE